MSVAPGRSHVYTGPKYDRLKLIQEMADEVKISRIAVGTWIRSNIVLCSLIYNVERKRRLELRQRTRASAFIQLPQYSDWSNRIRCME